MTPAEYFADFDFDTFWIDGSPLSPPVPPPDDETVARIQTELGLTLPDSYLTFVRHRNGGLPARCVFPTKEPTGWADDHVMITGLFALDSSTPEEVRFWHQEWGYPAWGFPIADTPSGGHELIMLDYRRGPSQEPSVVYVDQESDDAVVPLTDNFETFIRGLRVESDEN